MPPHSLSKSRNQVFCQDRGVLLVASGVLKIDEGGFAKSFAGKVVLKIKEQNFALKYIPLNHLSIF